MEDILYYFKFYPIPSLLPSTLMDVNRGVG